MKHTDGNWEIDGMNVVVRGRGVVATIQTPQNGGTFDCEGNKSLISAAPDLLAALEDRMSLWGSRDATSHSKKAQGRRAESWERAALAVAKAKGKRTEESK